MKSLIIIVALAALAGCATPQPGPPNYGSRAYDPNGWQTVSVTPVPLGTGAQAAAAGQAGTTTSDYAQTPAQGGYAPVPAQAGTTTIVTQPMYVAPPVYAVPAPVYVAPPPPYYWWPPISIGLGFNWSHWSGGHGGGWHGGGGGWHGGGGHHR